MDYFVNHRSYKLVASDQGVGHLATVLNGMLLREVEKQIPTLKRQINEFIKQHKTEMESVEAVRSSRELRSSLSLSLSLSPTSTRKKFHFENNIFSLKYNRYRKMKRENVPLSLESYKNMPRTSRTRSSSDHTDMETSQTNHIRSHFNTVLCLGKTSTNMPQNLPK